MSRLTQKCLGQRGQTSEVLVCAACGRFSALVFYYEFDCDDMFNGVRCTACGVDDALYIHGGYGLYDFKEVVK